MTNDQLKKQLLKIQKHNGGNVATQNSDQVENSRQQRETDDGC